MSTQDVDILPTIQAWLSDNHQKICSFWVGADWHGWARFELFMALENALPDCLVTHSNDDFWAKSTDLIDILIEPRSGTSGPIAIKLRCEKVNENEGSFETFAEQYNEDWEHLQQQGVVQDQFDGTRVLLLGFSGEAMGEGTDNFSFEPKPEHFNSGEVHGWVKEMVVKS